MSKKELIFIIGMHRSGTSMLGNILQNIGYDIGDKDQSLKPSYDNYKGFSERTDIIEINDDIFSKLNYPLFPNNDQEFDLEKLPIEYESNIHEKIEKLLEHLTKSQTKSLIKDPRISLTLPLWSNPPPNTKIKIAFIYRNPIDVAKSLLKRDNINSLDEGVQAWEIYNETALSNIEKFSNVVYFKYENFFENTNKEISRLLELNDKITTKEAYLSTYSEIEPKLRNNRSDEELDSFLTKNPSTRKTWNKINKIHKKDKVSDITNPIKEQEDFQQILDLIILKKSEQLTKILDTTFKDKEDLYYTIKELRDEIGIINKKLSKTSDNEKELGNQLKEKEKQIILLKQKIDSNSFLIKRIILNIKNKILAQ